jgi:hypothetical protein
MFKNLFLKSMLSWLSLGIPLASAATVYYNNGFESGNLNGFACSGNCPKVDKSVVAGGKYSGNFDLTRSMDTPYRTEVVLTNTPKFQFEKEYWLGFNYRYEDWAIDYDSEMAPFQIHNTPDSWTRKCGSQAAWGTAPFFMGSSNDVAGFYTYGGKKLSNYTIKKKTWYSVVVHFRMSKGTTGYIEAWINGTKIGQVNGQNVPVLDVCGYPMKEPYFKMGIYKWNWKVGRPATGSSRRQLFIDNLKLAIGADGYNQVAPGITVSVVLSKPPPSTLSDMVSDSFSQSNLNSGLWKFYDPAGTCKITKTGNQVSIAIPARLEKLFSMNYFGSTNLLAPRSEIKL